VNSWVELPPWRRYIADMPGTGVNLRRQIAMTPDEVATYLTERRAAAMCTVNVDGTIHAVAMWYALLDGALVVTTKAKSQKVQNLRRDPRLTVLVDSGDTYGELRGVELVGRGEIVEDRDGLFAIGVAVHRRNTGSYSDEDRPAIEALIHKRVGIRLHVERTVSWDHRKLPSEARHH
jgi:PPOX class probable F420-dependent enzyme